MARAKKKTLYSVHPGVKMVQGWIERLPEKTGKTLDQWVEIVQKDGPATEKERREWLKQVHGFGTNHAWWLAERADGKALMEDSPESYLLAAEKYVETMFAGSKAGLRPIYDTLLRFGLDFAKDVKACPCQTMVPFYRKHVFSQIKPTTRTRIDFGFALGDTPVTGRLIDTGGLAKKDRITHRIPITTIGEIDVEVKHWFQVAYDRDA